jgi:hypothetical protein
VLCALCVVRCALCFVLCACCFVRCALCCRAIAEQPRATDRTVEVSHGDGAGERAHP